MKRSLACLLNCLFFLLLSSLFPFISLPSSLSPPNNITLQILERSKNLGNKHRRKNNNNKLQKKDREKEKLFTALLKGLWIFFFSLVAFLDRERERDVQTQVLLFLSLKNTFFFPFLFVALYASRKIHLKLKLN